VTPHLGTFILRRAVSAIVLVLVVSSAAVILARLAPGDHLSEFELTPAQIAAERHRLGLDAPLYVQYFGWLRRVARFDLGESTRYPGRKVRDLIAERIGNTAMLGLAALVLATALGIPLGVLSATNRRGPLALTTRGVSIVLLALPPVILSLGLLFLASTTGWFPVGGLPSSGGAEATLRHWCCRFWRLDYPWPRRSSGCNRAPWAMRFAIRRCRRRAPAAFHRDASCGRMRCGCR
jgi:peptide/nickel transport system permease protein